MPNNFKFSEAFNSQTLRGRANVAKATWISVGVIYLMVKMQRNNTERRDGKLYCKSCQQVMLTG